MSSEEGFPAKYVLSFGGGVNTVALMILLAQSREPLDDVVFADTGCEVPETYSHLNIAKSYLEAHGIPFRVVRKNNGKSLYETSWKRRVFPSAVWRWSTRDFKVNPIHRYYRSLGTHVNQYIGIAYDEIWRMKDSRVAYVTNLYPLVDRKMTRLDCEEVIQEAGLPVPVKSGCFFCPFNSMGRWRWLTETHPELYAKAIALEENSKHFPAQRLTDQVFRERASITLREMGEILRKGQVPDTEDVQIACGGECMT